MPENDPVAPARRRSSFAYDPARDTFKEIPDTKVDEAIAEDVDEEAQQIIAATSSPATDRNTDEQSRKRRRSDLPEERLSDVVEKSDSQRESASFKKQRTSISPPRGDHRSPRPATNGSRSDKPAPRVPSDLPRIPRKPREEGEVSTSRHVPSAFSRRPDGDDRQRNNHTRRRSQSPRRRSPSNIYRRRSPPRERRNSPSPIRDSPPRDIIRPGGARGRGRNVLAEQQRLAAEREQKHGNALAPTNRGVQEVSNQFYNARPEWVKERGRDWRRNESQIKGLRSYNNWVKSCLIQRFSPEEKKEPEELGWGEEAKEPEEQKPLLVLDIGCGKGGDLGKWQLAPQVVGLYVGLDPAETSIAQARERYQQMRRGRRPIFDARFLPQDCFGAWIGDVGIIREVGIDPNAGSGQPSRWGGGGFDVVAAMFTMHYAFESEEKVKMMLRNVAGSLKKGGRFIGVVPNSDVCAEHIRTWFSDKESNKTQNGNGTQDPTADKAIKEDGEADDEEGPTWGNSLYNVRFPNDPVRPLQADGSFRPPFSWKYTYWMAEAVDVPEFVVPWEAFRAIAESYNLEQRYRKPFLDIWDAEQGNREMMSLALRMGVTKYEGGELGLTPEEREAVGFYHAFCFVKV
ncbi:mRNA cap guanine-N7 methyltransferase [Elasticomyces elasticus]|uniref:mRNA cap guanine-N(7) methyltransferase n=1 Tax=Exophiala sideris TaxID=1016849 RepID=A0ABR0IY46_9EURO|nr:mRNA cap guanine-N7 methyltransferase [Elasticomyces elasticus]KAK5022481.1 mRNA cap guanine-N7 methyltransferase [Exophiala sideris]KAK5028009.1 mRNA cap guanine-N7 methyltransferase [Exophiala sideris]KAK5051751.1 mRNA cap guanine-N7 methyltransferase [Exophiala sideris]KAK5177918.1 mRNA cap guanine-N7 methyltransferase [Eurotiomycetes sp. CCFEE 6388]